VSSVTIGIPSFILALEPNRELVRGRFLRNVLRAAMPGGLTDFLLVFCAMGFGFAFDLPADTVGTICTMVVLTVGISVLWGVCRPFTTWHWVLWGSCAVLGYGGAVLVAPWLDLVWLDLGGSLVLLVLLALVPPTLYVMTLAGDRLRSTAVEVIQKIRQ